MKYWQQQYDKDFPKVLVFIIHRLFLFYIPKGRFFWHTKSVEIQFPTLHVATGARRVHPTVFISRFLVWRCGLLVVMTRKVFWNAYRQRYVKSLRNRPFNPKIIRENLWFGFKATNSHKFPQIIFLSNLAESVWALTISEGANHITT